MGLLYSLLIFVIVIVVAIFVVDLIAGSLGLSPKGVQIIKIILCCMAALWLIQAIAHPFGGFYFH